eukprot:jgi/Botrbrau1/8862/Bobra.50_2s0019.1
MDHACFLRAPFQAHKNSLWENVFCQHGNKRRRCCSYSVRPTQGPAVLASASTWSFSEMQDDSSSRDAKAWELAPAFSANKEGTAGRRPKPLKINLDLLLYRARMARQESYRVKSVAEKINLQKQSEAALRKCLELDPTDARTYVSLGKLLLNQRRYEEARKIYEDGCAATGGVSEYIWQAWAVLEMRQGNTSRARQLFDAATAANDQHAAAWHGWGLLEKREGDVVRARDIWMKGVIKTRSTPNPYLYQSLALLAGEMGYVEEARKWFREGTSTVLGAASHALWHAWAMLEANQGEEKAVRYLFARGLEANPRSRYIFLSWALWEDKQGQKEVAKDLLMRGATLNRRDPAILQAWALLEEESGNLPKARRLLERASTLDPHHVPVWQAWGSAGAQGRATWIEPGSFFQQGVWAQPGSKDVTYVWQAWGVLEAEAGHPQLARQLFKCAVKADPESVPSWIAWADLEESLGNKDRGRDIRNLRSQMYSEVVLPPDFGAGLEIPPAQPNRMSIASLVSDWYPATGGSAGSCQEAVALLPDREGREGSAEG